VPGERRRKDGGTGHEAGGKEARDDEVMWAEPLTAPSPRFLDEVLVAHEPFNGST